MNLKTAQPRCIVEAPPKRKPKELSPAEIDFYSSLMGLGPMIGQRGWQEAEIARLIDNGD